MNFGPWRREPKEHDLEREIRDHLDLEAAESGPGANRPPERVDRHRRGRPRAATGRPDARTARRESLQT